MNADVQSLLTGQPEFVTLLRGGLTEQLESLLGADVLKQHDVDAAAVLDAALAAFDAIPFQEDDVQSYAKSALQAATLVVKATIDDVDKQIAAFRAANDQWEKRQREFDEFCRMRTPPTVQ